MTFTDLTSIAAVDARWKVAFVEQDCATNQAAYWSLSEEYRRAHEQIAHGRRADEKRTENGTVDPDGVRPHVLRNWAMSKGISLARKGKVPVAIENEYRAEHNLPLLNSDKVVKPTMSDVTCSVTELRQWARANDIDVPARGRIGSDVVAAWVAAHPRLEI